MRKRRLTRLSLEIMLIISLFLISSIEAEAKRTNCPEEYECARIDDILKAGAICADGFICNPAFGLKDCPDDYICFTRSKIVSIPSSTPYVPLIITPTTPTPTTSPTPALAAQCFTFERDISFGSSLSEVSYLQKFFELEGFLMADSEKTPFSYVGNTTYAAAKGYQGKYGSVPQAGYVGPLTRAKLNSTYGCR